MLQNNWVSEKLVHEQQRQLMEKADRIRQSHKPDEVSQVRKQQNALAKLHAESHNL